MKDRPRPRYLAPGLSALSRHGRIDVGLRRAAGGGEELDPALIPAPAPAPNPVPAPAPAPAPVAPEAEAAPAKPFSLLSDDDLYLFNEGTHYHLYEKLGSHLVEVDGVRGVYFAVWAPGARQVWVIGDFNDWDEEAEPLAARAWSGIWEGFVPGVKKGALYKYHIESKYDPERIDKADPFAVYQQCAPDTASIVWDHDYRWHDRKWIEARAARRAEDPLSIYEVHLGSWRRVPDEDRRSLRYRELAPGLAHYVRDTAFTHVEFMPVMEHPFFGSWGYQITGYFAPTSRQGRPQDFMHLVDVLHQKGIGVILDWVPSHFPDDPHGLGFFDGTYLFEHADPRKGKHPDWDSLIFNYGRPEVRSFLISNAFFWIERYHADALRVDAVASMLYLDYSRKDGEWVPNEHGGRENLAAIRFLKQFNDAIHEHFPGVRTIAEESTAWPKVTASTDDGGLGFDLKWDMGWMHDTLRYLARWPIHRKFHHQELTFRQLYAQTERFVLALSHDEVVHGKYSLADKMPGDEWHKFANLRLLFGYMFAQQGRKLVFMGGEFGQWHEWNHDRELDWELLSKPLHGGLRAWLRDLNRAYVRRPALHARDEEEAGFAWIDCEDAEQSTLSLSRQAGDDDPIVIAVFNFTAVPRRNLKVGAPVEGFWTEILNSNAREYGGTGLGNMGGLETVAEPLHGHDQHLSLTLPPLSALFFEGPARTRSAESGAPGDEDARDDLSSGRDTLGRGE